MSELHLESASDRLINGMGAKVCLGKLSVSYKESLKIETPWVSVSPQLESQGYHFSLKIEPLNDSSEFDIQNENKSELLIPLRDDNSFPNMGEK